MTNDYEGYIYLQLSKRYKVSDGVVLLHSHVFSWMTIAFDFKDQYEASKIFYQWCQLVIGEKYKLVWYDGEIHYYNKTKLHREGGPAVIYSDGSKEWFNHGDKVSDDFYSKKELN